MKNLRADEIVRGREVRVRGARWRVIDVRAHDAVRIVTLRGVAPPLTGVERRLLAPFDVLDPIEPAARLRRAGARRWRRACRALLAADTPPLGLRAARDARIDLLPYQLEPALAVVRGFGVRLLLADEVGLGKTVQAGLVAAELRSRGAIERLIVLAPAGLCPQWTEELGARFAIEAPTVDGRSLRLLKTALPVGMNPWSTLDAAAASIDYVKRPEVLAQVTARRWDLVIVDEAHGVAGDSDRQRAVQRLASAAAYVLLITATPHSGDQRSFASLCSLGAAGDDPPLVVFRRTRADAGLAASRRVHILSVRGSDAEWRMLRLLDDYASAVRAERGRASSDAWLALTVLHKRVYSSAWSLAESIDRRRAVLSASTGGADPQLALPFDDRDGELLAADEAPAWPAQVGLEDRDRELRMLTALAAAARAAAHRESKLSALRRLLRRSKERAIVFTEYRDTLTRVQRAVGGDALALHGGLGRRERQQVLADFSGGARRLLLATDAAAEGLNLHHDCRLVISLELPWNPTRLEQRIGRVDRIGQTRRVHAFHLVAARSGEARILERLKRRIACARAELGAADPLGADEERANARLVAGGTDDADDAEPEDGCPDGSGADR